MSCISKINHAYSSLNEKQKNIADYILNNAHSVINMSVQELALKTSCAASSIIRFCKRLGFDGYTALKIELASDLSKSADTLFEDHPSLQGTFLEFITQEHKAYLNTINKTFDLMNFKNLEKVIELARNARRIYLIGIGASSHICEDFVTKLTRIDILALFYKDSHVQVANSVHLTSEDLVIAISYRGHTSEINLIMKHAMERNITTVAITQNNGSELTHYSDIILPVTEEENEFRLGAITSRNSTQIITDLIYLGLTRLQIDKASQDLVDSRKMIYKLRDN